MMERRVQLEFEGRENLPTWAISHYLQQTEINYIKLVVVQRICELAADGVDLNRLMVATSSAELFPDKTIKYSDFKRFESLAWKSESTPNFWHIISRHHRPVVFYDTGENYRLIYDPNEGSALRIRNVSVNSPVSLNLEGVSSAVVDLYYASDRERRSQLSWENEQLGQVGRNIEDIARASTIVNNPNVPEGLKIYANEILDQALSRQKKLNEQIGMANVTIRTIA